VNVLEGKEKKKNCDKVVKIKVIFYQNLR